MSEPERFTIFIDEKAVSAAPDSKVLDALRERDPATARLLEEGTAYVTDGVGRRIDPGTRVRAGDIFRIVRSAPRGSQESEG